MMLHFTKLITRQKLWVILLLLFLLLLLLLCVSGRPVLVLEGMTGQTDELESLKRGTELMQTTYTELKSGMEDQKNRIEGNAQMIMKVMSDAPKKSSEVTGVSVNSDDPSKTAIPKVSM